MTTDGRSVVVRGRPLQSRTERSEGMSMAEVERDPGTWRTRDQSLAAFLAMVGHPPVHLEKEQMPGVGAGVTIFWHFAESEDLDDEVDTYLQGDAKVEPKAYAESLSRIKHDMYRFIRGS
jgi:Domain of unknown function (DUF5659)